MRAIFAPERGQPDDLAVVQTALPQLAVGDVLIRVAAAGVNRADVMQRHGNYPPPEGASEVLGLECSGTIVAVGLNTSADLVGQEVCALLPGGGYAEYVSAPAEHTLPVPPGVNIVDAASIAEAAATVWSNLFDVLPVREGSRVLVHGGSSGIGSMAIQLVHAVGAHVSTTVGSAEKAAYCRGLGADVVVNYKERDFADAFAELDMRFDAILDLVGGDYLDRNLRLLNRNGLLAIIATQGGAEAPIDLGQIIGRNITLTGRGLRMRPHHEKSAIVAALKKHVWPLYGSGALTPTTHRIFDLSQAMDAHRLMESSAHLGKLLIKIDNATKGH